MHLTLNAAPVLSRQDARTLTDEVRRDAETLWSNLLRLYEGAAHTALGYPSWGAYFESEFGGSKSHAYRLLDAGRVAEALSPHLGNGAVSEAQSRELVPVLRDEGEDAVVEVYRQLRDEHGDSLTAAKVHEAVNHRLQLDRKIAVLKSSDSVEWYTPARYVQTARDVLGGIDLDPASCAEANRTVCASVFYDAESDGLSQPWVGRVWMNPPYGRACPDFVAKLLAEYQAGKVNSAIALLNAYSTDTRWFQPLWDHTLCFTDHRIDFNSPATRTGKSTPTTGSVFVYLGPTPERFTEAFDRYGAVVQRATAKAA